MNHVGRRFGIDLLAQVLLDGVTRDQSAHHL
jgi:hypothetical protein